MAEPQYLRKVYFLTKKQIQKVNKIAKKNKITPSYIIRQLVDEYN